MNNQLQAVSTQQLSPFRSFFAQLDETWRLYRNNWKKFIGLILLGIFVPVATIILVIAALFFIPIVRGVLGEQIAKYLVFLSGVGGGIIGFLSSFSIVISFIALIVSIAQEKEGKMGQSLKRSFHLFFRFLGGGVLISLMISLGSVFFLAPGLILAVILSFWPFIVVKENLGTFSAIKRCFQIIKGYFWVVCLRYLAFLIAVVLVQFIFILLGLKILAISPSVAVIAFILYLAATIFFINILNFIFVYVIYKNINERKMIDPRAVYKLSIREKIISVLLITVLLASAFYQFFLKERQPVGKKQITPEEELIYKFLQKQGAKVELPLENIPTSPEMEKALKEEKPVNIIRDQQRLEDLKKIQDALDSYLKDHGEYPRAKGILGKDFICLVSYTAIPAYQGLINATQLAESPYICNYADKIYLESFQSIPSTRYSNFAYDSLCSIECLPGEKNNFYTINFATETLSVNALESDLENLQAGSNCLTSKGLNILGETGGCLSQEIVDADKDDLSDFRELYIYKTDRFNSDTDGDGYLDGAEVRAEYNPVGYGRLVR